VPANQMRGSGEVSDGEPWGLRSTSDGPLHHDPLGVELGHRPTTSYVGSDGVRGRGAGSVHSLM
jgi:hypothetical protein